MYFQQAVEQKAFEAGGGGFVAPALRVTDFVKNKISSTLPDCSYVPGIRAADFTQVLPPFIYTSLQKAFLHFDKKMKGYVSNEAIVVATESRTSSPVRVPRDLNLHKKSLPLRRRSRLCRRYSQRCNGWGTNSRKNQRIFIPLRRLLYDVRRTI